MAYYKICPYCGAHLDCCEKCDCQSETASDNEPPMYSIEVQIVTQHGEVKNSA